MTTENIYDLFTKRGLYPGRLTSSSKRAPEGCLCVWNANVITRKLGKIWYGDLNLTKEGDLLREISKELDEPLYVLREMDCRFETENDPIEVLISRAVWSSEQK